MTLLLQKFPTRKLIKGEKYFIKRQRSETHVVHTTLQDGGITDKLLCEYKCNNTWEHVQSEDMIMLVRTATKQLKLHHQGINPDLVG